jgi:phage terminase Nu1 subunit (DNA packaging protein)
VPPLALSKARREAALAEQAEIELARLKGTLIDVAQARADVINRFTIVRTRIQGVPARLAQRLPHLAAEVVPVLDGLLREALEELAAADDTEEAGPC